MRGWENVILHFIEGRLQLGIFPIFRPTVGLQLPLIFCSFWSNKLNLNLSSWIEADLISLVYCNWYASVLVDVLLISWKYGEENRNLDQKCSLGEIY